MSRLGLGIVLSLTNEGNGGADSGADKTRKKSTTENMGLCASSLTYPREVQSVRGAVAARLCVRGLQSERGNSWQEVLLFGLCYKGTSHSQTHTFDKRMMYCTVPLPTIHDATVRHINNTSPIPSLLSICACRVSVRVA